MRVRSSLAVLFLVSSLNPALAERKAKAHSDPQTCAAATTPGRACSDAQPAITVNSPRPVPLFGASKVTIDDVNLFRFDVGTTITSAPIAAASLPGGMGFTPTQISAVPNAMTLPPVPAVQTTRTTGKEGPRGYTGRPQYWQTPQLKAPPAYPDACNSSDWQDDPSYRKLRLTICWNGIQNDVANASVEDVAGGNDKEASNLHNLRKEINQSIRAAAAEQRCYALKLKIFAQPLLTHALATDLANFATKNATPGDPDSCYQTAANDDWPFQKADELLLRLERAQVRLSKMSSLPGYADWLGPDTSPIAKSNAALAKSLADMLTEVTSYTAQSVAAGAGSPVAQSYHDFIAAVDANKAWRLRLHTIATAAGQSNDPAALRVTMSLNNCHEFYGKGRTDTIQLHVTDASSAAAQDIPIATNTCMPRTIASTGVGVTFLASPVYGFVPADPTTGTQVIGKTAVNGVSPLYAVLYNVQPYKPRCQHSAEMFLSPGIGLTSSSNTTVADFLAGLSIGFARRVLFVTGSVDFGRRDELLHGFEETNPKGSLTSIPTRSAWKAGAMLSVTFGIGPS